MRIRVGIAIGLAAVLAGGLLAAPAFAASLPKVLPTLKLAATSSASRVEIGDAFHFKGKVTPAKKGVVVQRLRLVDGNWKSVAGSKVKTDAKGKWKMELVAPSEPTTLKFKINLPESKSTPPVWRTVYVYEPLPPPTITLSASPTPHPAGAFTTFTGLHTNLGSDFSIAIERLSGDQWQTVTSKIGVGRVGWSGRVPVGDNPGLQSFRAVVVASGGTAVSEVGVINVTPALSSEITRLGPGTPSRILGMDISRWQRIWDSNGDGTINMLDDGKSIDYALAYERGMRFVFIKASDGSVNPDTGATLGDNFAKRFYAEDRAAAQAAGLFTGLYHYPGMIDSNAKKAIVLDARDEAIQAVSRLADVGGYDAYDLPMVLDVESDSLPGSGISDTATQASVSLWVKTWLIEVEARTGRMPIVYTGPSMYKQLDATDPFWTNVLLWVARYPGDRDYQLAVNMLNKGHTPDMKPDGAISVTSGPWYRNGATDWAFWQYSSAVEGSYYGIQNGSKLDTNVFFGTGEQLLALTSYVWTPRLGDYTAINSEVTATVLVDAAAADQPVTLTVRIERASDGAPVVAGSLTMKLAGRAVTGGNVMPNGVGVWTVTLPAQPSGFVWQDLVFSFADSRGWYAGQDIAFPLQIV